MALITIETYYRELDRKSDLFSGIPISMNRWRNLHWAQKKKIKEHTFERMESYWLLSKQRFELLAPPATIEFTIYKAGVLNDYTRIYIDDYIDWFVKKGFIADDSPLHLNQPIIKQEKVNIRLAQKCVARIWDNP